MTRPSTLWSRVLPGALIAALLSMSMGLAFVGPVEAAPRPPLSVSVGPSADGPARAEGPQPRFQYRVMGQATATETPAVTPTATQTPTPTVTPIATATLAPLTGTLIVCKQIQLLNPGGIGGVGGIGGIGGIGGLNPPGPLGGIGFNPLGPIGGPNGIGGIGGVGGVGGVGGLGLQGSTVTFTTPPGGPVIPAITIPAAQLGPVCAAGVAAAAGTVAVTEVVPAGFTLNSVTGGTLSGNTGTATITSGTTTTLTFINVPINVNIIPNQLPILPPPPLQFLPPPPPPLLPPPPIVPMGGAAAAAPGAYPEVPVIPEADSAFLVVSGLVALGGLVGLRNLRRRRDGTA